MTPSLVLSGAMFSGKTTTAGLLEEEFGFVVASARRVLRDLAGDPLISRADLQRFGGDLEQETGGAWLGNATLAIAHALSPKPVVVDSARTRAQIDSVRGVLDRVYHVHLTASYEERLRRFTVCREEVDAHGSFEESSHHPVERDVPLLGAAADLIVDSEVHSPGEVVQQVAAILADV